MFSTLMLKGSFSFKIYAQSSALINSFLTFSGIEVRFCSLGNFGTCRLLSSLGQSRLFIKFLPILLSIARVSDLTLTVSLAIASSALSSECQMESQLSLNSYTFLLAKAFFLFRPQYNFLVLSMDQTMVIPTIINMLVAKLAPTNTQSDHPITNLVFGSYTHSVKQKRWQPAIRTQTSLIVSVTFQSILSKGST